MNINKAKAAAYIVVSMPVLLIGSVIIKSALFASCILLDWIVEPMVKQRRNIMLDGMRLIYEASED